WRSRSRSRRFWYRAGMKSPLAIIVAMLVAATAAGLARLRAEELRPPPAELEFDVPPFPVEVARPFSFGFSSLAADLTFIEAIQIPGARKTSTTAADEAPRDRALARLLNYTVDMDPRFSGAYRYAGSALPRHTVDGRATGVLAAELILRKGVREVPEDW